MSKEVDVYTEFTYFESNTNIFETAYASKLGKSEWSSPIYKVSIGILNN